MNFYKYLLLFSILIFIASCEEDDNNTNAGSPNPPTKKYLTENVIVVVIDGPRYTETWGDSTHQHQPRLANDLASQGAIYTDFRNNGETWTVPGHVAISTGNYQAIANNGTELPQLPSMFQLWLKQTEKDSTKAWIVASKDKLSILANTMVSTWNNEFMPATNCGVGGLGAGSGYRHDSITFDTIQYILSNYHPNLMLINFREPDYSGHANNWANYLKGIENTDQYLYQIWEQIQNDPIYANKTTLIATNDHGRHLDGHKDGFVSHGDDCEGCRHINLFAVGPDFKSNTIISTTREQIDISATIAELLEFDLPYSNGQVMDELFISK